MKCMLKDVINLKALWGKKKNVRRIHSPEDLLALAEKVNSSGENHHGLVVELGCDIDMNGICWQPIGCSVETPFCGEFDGKGHSIRGLRLQTEANYVGLFGVVTAMGVLGLAEVRNLCLQDFEIVGTTENSWTGSIAGYVGEGVLIENCRTNGVVRSWSFVGGILGVAGGSVGIRECCVEGKVIGENINVFLRKNMAGSIAGKLTTNSVRRNCECRVVDKNGNGLRDQVGKFDDEGNVAPGGK